jgi:hypothetical protein
MTSRIRCSCGRVYDPQKHTQCPDCGAESPVESVVVSEKIKTSEPPKITPEPKPEEQGQSESIVDFLKTMPRPVYAATAVFLLLILFFSLRPRHGGKSTDTSGGERVAPAAHEEPSPTQSATIPPLIPPGSMIPPSYSMGSVNLNEMIANAAPGSTVTVPAGLYPGGLVVTRGVHIVADPRSGGQIFIQSEGKEGLTVRAKGVSVQGIQFVCNGIGALPAISVADGADLQMDGCKVQSMSALGVEVNGNASIKALGSAFSASKGTAVRLDKHAQGSFTQSAFSNSIIGLALMEGAKADLHSCAFEQIGMSESSGAIIAANGDTTELTGDDCHFSNNSVGIQVSDKASIALTKSEFKDNNGLSSRGVISSGVLVLRDSSHGTIRSSSLTNSSPYALNVMSGSNLLLEDSEIVGSRTVGLVIGDRNSPGAHADVKRSHFSRNATGIGVYAGGSATIEDSECRGNNEGVLVFDAGSQVKLIKTSLTYNRDHGLYAYSNADVTAIDSNIQNNARGAQSGTQRKSVQRASVRLENCHFGGNQVFGAGAFVQSQLALVNCVFDGTDKTNVYHERGAIVQTDAAPVGPDASASASPENSPESDTANNSGSSTSQKTKRKVDKYRRNDDLSRLIRRWVPGR